MVRQHVRHGVVLASLAFVFIQCYVLYSSTFHLFKHHAPMCPACVAMKNLDHSIIDAVPLIETRTSYARPLLPALRKYQLFTLNHYQSRAPPNANRV